MTPAVQVPESFAFLTPVAPLQRPAQADAGREDEADLHLLAHEIARHAPELARQLRRAGLRRLREQVPA